MYTIVIYILKYKCTWDEHFFNGNDKAHYFYYIIFYSKAVNSIICKIKFKEFCCLEINFIKICPEMALKYFFEKMWFYMKYMIKNRR
jgi:hypothetical protein